MSARDTRATAGSPLGSLKMGSRGMVTTVSLHFGAVCAADRNSRCASTPDSAHKPL